MTEKAKRFMQQLFQADVGKSMARRLLTFLLVPVWLLLHLLWAATGILHGMEMAGSWQGASEIVGAAANELNSVAWIVFIFYFSTDHAKAVIEALKNRRGGGTK